MHLQLHLESSYLQQYQNIYPCHCLREAKSVTVTLRIHQLVKKVNKLSNWQSLGSHNTFIWQKLGSQRSVLLLPRVENSPESRLIFDLSRYSCYNICEDIKLSFMHIKHTWSDGHALSSYKWFMMAVGEHYLLLHLPEPLCYLRPKCLTFSTTAWTDYQHLHLSLYSNYSHRRLSLKGTIINIVHWTQCTIIPRTYKFWICPR